jgi:hypothetical protein
MQRLFYSICMFNPIYTNTQPSYHFVRLSVPALILTTRISGLSCAFIRKSDYSHN